MKKFIYILPLFAGALLVNCGGSESEQQESTEETTVEKGETTTESNSSNTYSVDPSTVTLKWTSFKLAEKVGVDGEFTTYELSGYNDNASSIHELMTGSVISMDVTSTKTGDEARDGKIINSFFGSMLETAQISAILVSMEGDDKGTAVVNITMNGQSLDQEMHWMYREDLSTFILQGTINIPDWGAQDALDQLTTVCEEKHKGTGDKAITWPDVEVNATVKVNVMPAESI